MAKQIDHSTGSAISTVGLETGKGILGGILTMGAIGAFVVGGIAFAIGAPVLAPALIAGGLSAFFGATVGAVGGGVIGGIKGAAKVQDENAAYQAAARSANLAPTIQGAQQQAYINGVQDGQVHVVQQLQAAQEQMEQQTNFAAKFAKKGTVTPETIVAQRDAAGTPQIGG